MAYAQSKVLKSNHRRIENGLYLLPKMAHYGFVIKQNRVDIIHMEQRKKTEVSTHQGLHFDSKGKYKLVKPKNTKSETCCTDL